MEWKVQRPPMAPLLHRLPHLSCSQWPSTGTLLHPEFTLGFTLSVLYSMGLDTCIVTCVHHYIIQTISLPYKSCHLPVHTYLSPPNLAATDLFTVCTCILFLLPFLVVLNGNHQTFRNWPPLPSLILPLSQHFLRLGCCSLPSLPVWIQMYLQGQRFLHEAGLDFQPWS